MNTAVKTTKAKVKPTQAKPKSFTYEEAPRAFGTAAFNRNLSLAQLRIVDAILSFVRRGLRDVTGLSSLSLEAFTPTIRCRFLQSLTDSNIPAYPTETQQDNRDLAAADAMRAFHVAYQNASKHGFEGIPEPCLGVCEEKVELGSALEVLKMPPMAPPDHADLLEKAYLMARYNRIRCEQRITLLDLLCVAVSDLPLPAAAEVELARKYLRSTRMMHLSRQFGFSALLGGEALKETQNLVRHMYREGRSVMELLEVDGQHPGYYMTADEDALRAAINKP